MKAIKRGFFRRIGAPGVSFLALTVALVLTGPQAAWAKKHHASANAVDPTSVTACGTLSGSDTIYQLANDLTESGTGTCINMTGSNSTLDLFGYSITGPGATSTGAGINITSAADNDVIEGFNSTISGFKYGILDQSNNSIGDNVTLEDNQIGLELNGTSGGATSTWSNFAADSNTKQGVYFNQCTDECIATDFDASSNGADGVLITHSSGARINVFTATDNGGAGVHVGCTSGCGSNSDVRVGDAPIGTTTTPAVTGNQGDGIFLDASEKTTDDVVYLIKASGNGVTSGYDLHDASSTCGDNQWVGNDWGTANADGVSSPACIPLVTF
ncbi:MAG: hypothetical protein ABSB13_00955 [Candidatus Binatus sp.]|jgi:hypothetical protein|uniref:hypothetical protein n=1 Tax=Candidatus Binatus sp. TaxID=2811406 RepID=UPI003D1498C9